MIALKGISCNIYTYTDTYLFDQVISDMQNRERFMTTINHIIRSGKYRLDIRSRFFTL
jgi:hypothetical protein